MLNVFHENGVKAFDENNYAMARDLFLKAIDENPDIAESYFYLGKCYFFCDEKQQAISPLRQYIALKQNNLDEVANVSYAFDLLGQCHEAGSRDAAALVCYTTATKIYPSCASAWHNMGLFYIKSAQLYLETDLIKSAEFFQTAQAFIKEALTISSDNPVFLQTIASFHEQYIEVLERAAEDEDAIQEKIANHFALAIQYYRKALSFCKEEDLGLKNIISSNLTECLAQYGHYLYKNKQYKEAQENYLEALNLDPEHLVVLNQLGMSFFKLDCFPEARKYFSSILEKTEEKQEIADAWLNIACTHRLERAWEKAGEALSQAKKFAPEDPFIVDEEITLNESKLSAIHVSIPQTLFGNSNPDPEAIEHKVVQNSSLQLN